jgi:hypothetical protein
MAKKEKPPHIEAIMTARGLRAHTPSDAEMMVSLPIGKVFEIVPVSQRSNKQLKTYWKALGLVVKATNKWPTAEKLHRDIKMTLGYREQAVNMRTGEITLVPDSVALDKMEHEEFCNFMNQAMELVADTVGFDPLQFLQEAA